MATTPNPTDLQRLENKMYEAMTGGDAKTLEAMLSDDLQYIHSSDLVQTKQEVVNDHRKPRNRKITSSGAKTYCYPGVGVVSTVRRSVTDGGTPSEKIVRLRTVYVWNEEPQGWRLVYRLASRIPEGK